MVQVYVDLIRGGSINKKTGEPWKIEDVPLRWREQVREELEGQHNSIESEE